MDRQVVSEMVYDIVLSKVVGMFNDMSTDEFVNEVVSRLVESGVPVNTKDEEVMEEIKEVIGDKVVPLLKKVGEYIIDNQVVEN